MVFSSMKINLAQLRQMYFMYHKSYIINHKPISCVISNKVQLDLDLLIYC